MRKYDDVLGGGFRERSDDYLPSGYIQEQEPFKLTEEEYQWLISFCCGSG